MVVFILTLDYEIYGDGSGSLIEHIYKPAELFLKKIDRYHKPIVIFVEIAELETIEKRSVDPSIYEVLSQIKFAYKNGHEIGLHIHPQWYNASYQDGKWKVDMNEYNLCNLPTQKIHDIVSRGVNYLRFILDDNNYNPISFRAGNWLFQPTQPAADILFEHGVRIDSSVFKGGFFGQYNVDYRKAIKNGYYWKFDKDVAKEDIQGKLIEIPIYTIMVPIWRMFSQKRLNVEKKHSGFFKEDKIKHMRDYLRLRYPKKLDFCKLTKPELKKMFDIIIREDKKTATELKPIVAIGHTKDLTDISTVEYFINLIIDNGMEVTTFKRIYPCLI